MKTAPPGRRPGAAPPRLGGVTLLESVRGPEDLKRLDAKDMFIEEYAGGPLKAGDEKLLVYVYVPVK